MFSKQPYIYIYIYAVILPDRIPKNINWTDTSKNTNYKSLPKVKFQLQDEPSIALKLSTHTTYLIFRCVLHIQPISSWHNARSDNEALNFPLSSNSSVLPTVSTGPKRFSPTQFITTNIYLKKTAWRTVVTQWQECGAGWIHGTALLHISKSEGERNNSGKKTFRSLETSWFKRAALWTASQISRNCLSNDL